MSKAKSPLRIDSSDWYVSEEKLFSVPNAHSVSAGLDAPGNVSPAAVLNKTWLPPRVRTTLPGRITSDSKLADCVKLMFRPVQRVAAWVEGKLIKSAANMPEHK